MSDITPFSEQELALLASCRAVISVCDPSLSMLLKGRVEDLVVLAGVVGRSASLTTDLGFSSKARSVETLAAKLTNQGIEEVVNLPVKASLGRSFTVSKLHLYGFLLKIAQKKEFLADQLKQILACYHTILFSLMAEDLYISIISDSMGNESWTRRATRDLMMMWEERSNAQADSFAPLMQQLWDVRHTLVPVLGTLLGTVELLQLSFRLPPTWHDFLAEKGSDVEVAYSMDEFLFSLSFEQLKKLQEIMEEKKVGSISREVAHQLLGMRPNQLLEGPNEDDLPAIRLYRSFLRRNALSRLRRDTDRPGPRRTIEQLLLLYLWSKDDQPCEASE